MKIKTIIVVSIVIIAALVIWGLVGGNIAEDVRITCDIGMRDNLCWKWHTNTIGEIQEGIEDLKDMFENN